MPAGVGDPMPPRNLTGKQGKHGASGRGQAAAAPRTDAHPTHPPLLRALADSTEGDGIWTLQASVFPENEASLKLHFANGYVIVGRRRRRIARMTHGPLTGQWRDTILIQRRSPAI